MAVTILGKTLSPKQLGIAAAALLALSGTAMALGGGDEAAAGSSASSASSPSTKGVKILSQKALHELALADVKLGNTKEEAIAALEAKGYAGTFNGQQGDFKGMDSFVTVKVLPDAQGVEHVWQVHYQQKFPEPQDIDAWKKRIEDRYGEPTRVDKPPLDKEYHIHYTTEALPAANIVALTHCEVRHSDIYSKPECKLWRSLQSTYSHDYSLIGLQALVQERILNIYLADASKPQEARERAKAAEAAAREAAAAETSSDF